MDIARAAEIVRALADGVDPSTGEVLPPESVYNHPEVIRALFTLLEQAKRSSAKPAPRNAGIPWTEDEEESLRSAFLAGRKLSEIAAEHGRTQYALTRRLERMGLK